jgi:hypothetical protein
MRQISAGKLVNVVVASTGADAATCVVTPAWAVAQIEQV